MGELTPTFIELARQLTAAGRRFDRRGWVLGTSGNFSAVVSREPLLLAMTPSGAWKGELAPEDIVQVDDRCQILNGGRKPSAEAPLHVEIARQRHAGSVLHTHSVWATVLSDEHAAQGGLAVHGYEMLKGLEGITTHEHEEWIPILDNLQDMGRLAVTVRETLSGHPACHAFLLRRHGLYTWGSTLPDAIRHVEIFEFLLETIGRTAERSSHGGDQDSR